MMMFRVHDERRLRVEVEDVDTPTAKGVIRLHAMRKGYQVNETTWRRAGRFITVTVLPHVDDLTDEAREWMAGR